MKRQPDSLTRRAQQSFKLLSESLTEKYYLSNQAGHSPKESCGQATPYNQKLASCPTGKVFTVTREQEKMNLHTKRLTLKPTTEKDFDILFKVITNEFVGEYLFDNEVLTNDQIEDFLVTSIRNFQSKHYGLWLIYNNKLNNVIGFVGLWDFFEEPQPQLVYAILPEYIGQGYASEASNEIVRYTFQELRFNYLTASCDTPNAASHKVAERIGMKKSKEEFVNGKALTFYLLGNNDVGFT